MGGYERPRPAVSPGGLSLVLAKESPPDPERKAALGALICRGMGFTRRFDIYTLASRSLYETGVLSFSRGGALRRSAYRGRFVERPRSAVSPGRLSLVLAKESPPDPERKAALGGLICRGVRITRRFDIYRLVSLNLYETGVRSFSRDGALRRSAYRVIF